MDTIEKALQKKAANTAANSASTNESQLLQKKKQTDALDQLADQKTDIEIKQQNQDRLTDIYPDKEKVEKQTTAQKSKIVTIDLKKLENLGFLLPQSSNSLLHQEFRQIKRPLLNNVLGRSAHPIENANIIQVTSSLAGEGKTFTAINLAISLTMEMDFNVLLVDADVIKSSITRILFNQMETKGLTDYLSAEVSDLSDVLLNTNIEKLKILPAGTQHKLSSELLNSQYMDNLLSEFSKRYENRIVIFDSAPVLQTNESKILANKVGQIVFVVEQNKTEKSVVKKALDLISEDAVVGLVMNKSRTGKSEGYYGYYGYGGPEK